MGLGEKKEIVRSYISQGLGSRSAFEIAGITKHQYYYRPKKGKRGRKASTHCLRYEGGEWHKVPNGIMLEELKEVKKDPDLDGGYHYSTHQMRQRGYLINPKKMNRLFKEEGLLKAKSKKRSKSYVKYWKVLPKGPLEVLEMDIKVVWIERDRRNAFVLNIIDTFSRKWLYQSVSFSIKQQQVREAWEYVIANYLQPNDCLKRKIHIEIRNDNDPRFSAQKVQEFFAENHLNQVFTHPYTPQENAHVESFHGILGAHWKQRSFWSLNELEQDLILFQEKYNNQRLHGSISHLSPNDFESLYHQGYIQTNINEQKRSIQFKLLAEPWFVPELTGNNASRGSLLPQTKKKESNGANNPHDLRSKKAPSVVSCNAKISSKNRIIVNSN